MVIIKWFPLCHQKTNVLSLFLSKFQSCHTRLWALMRSATSKRIRKTIMDSLKDSPIKCGEVEMKIKESDKWWLGQQVAAGGLSESVAATVAAREPKVKGAALEIVSIVKDWRSKVVGGLETALILWEACVIPTLLHGAGTWTNMTAGTVDKLNAIQAWFLRLVLEVGPGAPLAALRWDTGLKDMKL